MNIAFTDIMQRVWQHLVKAGLTAAGAAGMMGNMYAESEIIPNRVEMLCLQRLREHGRYYTDAVYTALVDDGTIGRAEFLNPLPERQYGYGLCQWTSPSRKAGLYDLCKSRKVSIGDLATQLDYLVQELRTKYAGVWKILTSTSDILTASNRVLMDFEIPGDTGAAIRETRYGYSKQFYDKYAKAGDKAVSTKIKTEAQAINTVINTAAAEEGYLEKASNSNLDSKTGNAGSANYTKYWRDILPEWQGQPWCAVFISWLFMQTFGLNTAKKLLGHWPFTYCPTLASMTSNRMPKKGSIVLFFKNGEYAHTELVVAVTSTTITTIGGNTSAGSSVVPNGGGVFRKTYKRTDLSASNKYYMPDYSLVIGKTTGASTAAKAPAATTSRVGNCTVTLGQYIQGNVDPEIKTIQIILNAKGYKGKDGKPLSEDGELGDNTAYAIEQLQRKAGMKNISFGTVAAKTWELLLK